MVWDTRPRMRKYRHIRMWTTFSEVRRLSLIHFFDTRHRLAVKYLFLTNDGLEEHSELVLEPFNATSEQNDYDVQI